MKKDALIFMQNQCVNLKLSEKDGFVSYTGEPKTEKEKYIANLISDKTIYVELWLKEDNILPNKKQINEGGGAYGGNYFIYDNKDSKEIEYVWATQYINVKQAKKVNQNGLVFWHEAAEAYESALLSRKKRWNLQQILIVQTVIIEKPIKMRQNYFPGMSLLKMASTIFIVYNNENITITKYLFGIVHTQYLLDSGQLLFCPS